ncbi:terminal oxidase subunit I [Salmonella enterica subsp. enterica]|uniref:Terminal oxidase subunit I n=1 Tax=Salmonella enterica I TaxID=59201 RepID=A0A447PKB7_SALET|nr:terminal oxidase subunit I [Salmonella enterica subsp. enterica]
MEFDAFFLARLQFAFTVSFHIIFPAITIGLASYLVVLEGLWLKTRNPVWRLALSVLAQNFCRQLRDGRGLRSGHGLPVRNELERFLPVRPAVSPGLY